jgi:histidinol-phosphatase
MDFPALCRRYMAGHQMGSFCNEQPITMKPADESVEHEIISLGEREQFVNADRVVVFDTLMREHPHSRTYCDCFGHALAIEGAVGAMVDFGIRRWDMAPIRVLVEEAGGTYVQLREYQDTSGAIRYDVVAGKPSVVQWVISGLDSLI